MARDRKGGEDGDDAPDPFAPVRLVHAKATHTAPGPSILWVPVATEFGVYLRPVETAESERDDERRMLAFVRDQGPGGFVRGALKKGDRPKGMTQAAATGALDRLVQRGAITATVEERGRTHQRAEVYRVRE